MEKAISVEERIRRAEDIYNRRNGQYSNVEHNNRKTKATKKRNVIKKMFMQISICLMIYVCFYVITNNEYVFSEEFRSEIKTKFSKENFNQIYTNVKLYIDKNILKKEQDEETNEEGKNEENNNNTENNNEETVNSENTNETTELDESAQMKKDAEDIKSKINFIVPIKGTISSTFGWRNPTTSTVPKYHTGLDIATTEGTVIKSATDGKVTLVSTEGDYGNHYKIEIEDVTIIYAHCKTLYLKEGDKVTQGQEIAEVGSTGNSTRTTFTF